jgi:phosphocarrier protein HPr
MMLAAANGSTIMVSADGTDEDAAMDAIVALMEDRFGEDRDDDSNT